MVVEVASAKAAMETLPYISENTSFLIASLTSLADQCFFNQLKERSEQCGNPTYIPHGAILGLDGILDGKNLISSVSITTRNPPVSLNLSIEHCSEASIIFKGTTREACIRFPKNVNSHAAIALVGLLFDRTQSLIVADPEVTTMIHEVDINGNGLHWQLKIESSAKSRVTGAYTPESIYQSIKRLYAPNRGLHII